MAPKHNRQATTHLRDLDHLGEELGSLGEDWLT
jgi:hypothetical protein